ncbi:hypothetical protein JCM8097_008097 [Rhodosporidiobolus ruineniae]
MPPRASTSGAGAKGTKLTPLEKKIVDSAERSGKSELTQEELFTAAGLTASVPVQDAINALIRKSLIQMLRTPSGTYIFRFLKKEEAKAMGSMDTEERLVLERIKEAGNLGIWSKTLITQTGLPRATIDKALKVLQGRKAIKTVKSVKTPTRKIYMLAGIQPSVELTGGPWFTENELDTELVDQLKKCAYKFLQTKSVPHSIEVHLPGSSPSSDATKFRPIYPVSATAFLPTVQQVLDYIVKLEVAIVELLPEHVEALLDLMVYDGIVEKVFVSREGVDEAEAKDKAKAKKGKGKASSSKSKGKKKAADSSDSDDSDSDSGADSDSSASPKKGSKKKSRSSLFSKDKRGSNGKSRRKRRKVGSDSEDDADGAGSDSASSDFDSDEEAPNKRRKKKGKKGDRGSGSDDDDDDEDASGSEYDDEEGGRKKSGGGGSKRRKRKDRSKKRVKRSSSDDDSSASEDEGGKKGSKKKGANGAAKDDDDDPAIDGDGEGDSGPTSQYVYRLVRPYAPVIGWTDMPCGRCPVEEFCAEPPRDRAVAYRRPAQVAANATAPERVEMSMAKEGQPNVRIELEGGIQGVGMLGGAGAAIGVSLAKWGEMKGGVGTGIAPINPKACPYFQDWLTF